MSIQMGKKITDPLYNMQFFVSMETDLSGEDQRNVVVVL